MSKLFAALLISLSFLHNYFDGPTKLLDLFKSLDKIFSKFVLFVYISLHRYICK